MNNIFELFKNFDHNTTDYVGVMFVNIYNDFPIHYKLYLDEDGKLKHHRCMLSFGEIQKKLKKKIDLRILLDRLFLNEDKYGIKVFNCSEHEYIIFGVGNKKVLLTVALGLDTEESSAQTLDVYCCPNDVDDIISSISECFVESNKTEKFLFGIATCSSTNIYTSWYDFEDKHIDIDANYNDDFKEPYNKVCQMIETENKTGLALLYGEPGTGKSSVIKHLIAKYPDKDFIFIDDSVLMSSPQDKLMSYFLENNETVFILEDCEKVLMSRDVSTNPLINTILNITDGIMGDVLGIKLICTFNTSLNRIDKALLRKGRLTVKYEFGKLCPEKVSKILGDTVVNSMTLAEIYNIDEENDYSKDTRRKIGYNN